MYKQMFNREAHGRHNLINHNNNASGCDLECLLALARVFVIIRNPRYRLRAADWVIYLSCLVRGHLTGDGRLEKWAESARQQMVFAQNTR